MRPNAGLRLQHLSWAQLQQKHTHSQRACPTSPCWTAPAAPPIGTTAAKTQCRAGPAAAAHALTPAHSADGCTPSYQQRAYGWNMHVCICACVCERERERERGVERDTRDVHACVCVCMCGVNQALQAQAVRWCRTHQSHSPPPEFC